MPVRGIYTQILVDGYDLSGQSNGLEINAQSGQIEVTPFQATAKQFIQEPVESFMTQRGYYSGGSAGDFEKTVYDRLATGSAYITALLNTQVVACSAYVLPATQASELQIQSPATNVITINARWMAGAGMKRGLRLFGGAITGIGSLAYIDLGAAGILGGFAYLHVTAITGTATNASIAVYSDDNTGFATPTAHGTFTFSATGAAQMVIAGTIDRYARLNVESLGGSGGFTIQGVIAVTGVTMM